MERWCNWNDWYTQLEKLDILLFCKLFSRFMSRCPFSGVELRGQVHLQKFWFVENSGEIPEISGTEVSTRLFTIELSDFFSEKKQHFWSSASVRIAEHEKSSCHFQASVQWFEDEQRLTKGCSLDSSHHIYHLPLHQTFIVFGCLRV